jgi:hypothetical protein
LIQYHHSLKKALRKREFGRLFTSSGTGHLLRVNKNKQIDEKYAVDDHDGTESYPY